MVLLALLLVLLELLARHEAAVLAQLAQRALALALVLGLEFGQLQALLIRVVGALVGAVGLFELGDEGLDG